MSRKSYLSSRRSGQQPPSSNMDMIACTLCLMMLVFILKREPVEAAPGSTSSYENARLDDAHDRRLAERERLEHSRLPWSEHLFGLPALSGDVCLVFDESSSMSSDGVKPIATTAIAGILLNHRQITRLRVLFFSELVEEVVPWTSLDQSPAESPDHEVATWLQDNLGASQQTAQVLANGQRPQVLRTVLERIRKRGTSTNLIGALTAAVESFREGPGGAAVVFTDGMHSLKGEPSELGAVQELLRQRLEQTGVAPNRRPIIHCVTLLSDKVWDNPADPPQSNSKAIEVANLLRGVAIQHRGVLLAIPSPKSESDASLDVIARGESPIEKQSPKAEPKSITDEIYLPLPMEQTP